MNSIKIFEKSWGLGIGDWGLGIGDWGLGPNPQSPIPNPQSPIPNPLTKSKSYVNFYSNSLIKNYNKNEKKFMILITNCIQN